MEWCFLSGWELLQFAPLLPRRIAYGEQIPFYPVPVFASGP